MVDSKTVLCYGSYYMELSEEEIWSIYTTFTRMNAAFSAMKSPLSERPTFHQLQQRVKTHIFLCMLAVAIENTLLDRGDDTSRWIIRQILKTHQVCSMLLPADNSNILNIRKASLPKPEHVAMYKLLNIPPGPYDSKEFWTKVMGKIVTKRQLNYLILQHFGQ